MENLKVTRSSRKHWFLFCIGLAFLFLTILLSELHGTTPAYAAPGTLYVDGATGQDIPACGTMITPCQTISYTLNSRASGGDTLRVAQGTYTENLAISIGVTLEGGYESTGWSRDLAQYETIIDGSGSQPVVGDWDGKEVRKAAVINDGVEYKMWFDGVNLLSEAQVGLATSADGIAWTKSPGNPVLSPGTPGVWGDPVVHFEAGSDGSVLDGFTVTGGQAQFGGGIHADDSVVIQNCLIRDNFASGAPGSQGAGALLSGGGTAGYQTCTMMRRGWPGMLA